MRERRAESFRWRQHTADRGDGRMQAAARRGRLNLRRYILLSMRRFYAFSVVVCGCTWRG